MTTWPNVAMTCPALPVPMISFIADTSRASRNSVVTSSRAGKHGELQRLGGVEGGQEDQHGPGEVDDQGEVQQRLRHRQDQHGDDADQRQRHGDVGLLRGFGEKPHDAALAAADGGAAVVTAKTILLGKMPRKVPRPLFHRGGGITAFFLANCPKRKRPAPPKWECGLPHEAKAGHMELMTPPHGGDIYGMNLTMRVLLASTTNTSPAASTATPLGLLSSPVAVVPVLPNCVT